MARGHGTAGAVLTNPVRADVTNAGATAALHTAAAEKLADAGRWEEAYRHLHAAIGLLQDAGAGGSGAEGLRGSAPQRPLPEASTGAEARPPRPDGASGVETAGPCTGPDGGEAAPFARTDGSAPHSITDAQEALAGPSVDTLDELARLRREHAEAREQSRRDSLTATYNRRYLDERLATLLDGTDDTGARTAGVAVALVDVDHFKQVNDTYGHQFGDRVLQRLVAELAAALPDGAFCARYGGEEFALVLPGLGLDESVAICEAARDRAARHPWGELDARLRVTVSIGIAHREGRPTDIEPLVGEADALLYTAKQAGRNAVAYRAGGVGPACLAGPAAGRRSVLQPGRSTG